MGRLVPIWLRAMGRSVRPWRRRKEYASVSWRGLHCRSNRKPRACRSRILQRAPQTPTNTHKHRGFVRTPHASVVAIAMALPLRHVPVHEGRHPVPEKVAAPHLGPADRLVLLVEVEDHPHTRHVRGNRKVGVEHGRSVILAQMDVGHQPERPRSLRPIEGRRRTGGVREGEGARRPIDPVPGSRRTADSSAATQRVSATGSKTNPPSFWPTIASKCTHDRCADAEDSESNPGDSLGFAGARSQALPRAQRPCTHEVECRKVCRVVLRGVDREVRHDPAQIRVRARHRVPEVEVRVCAKRASSPSRSSASDWGSRPFIATPPPCVVPHTGRSKEAAAIARGIATVRRVGFGFLQFPTPRWCVSAGASLGGPPFSVRPSMTMKGESCSNQGGARGRRWRARPAGRRASEFVPCGPPATPPRRPRSGARSASRR